MTRDELYKTLKVMWEQTDKSSREAIHQYNEMARELRKQLENERS